MKFLINKHSRAISIFIMITVLLCSLFALNYDISMFGDTRIPVTHDTFSLQLSNISELIDAEAISDSTSQAALIRQLFSRKGNGGYLWANMIGIILAIVISPALVAFSSLCTDQLKKSHRFIMDFIHKKDGKKRNHFT